MELSRLERMVLGRIHFCFPRPWEKTDDSDILTHEEKPLATRESLMADLNLEPPAGIEAALKRLVAFQLVKRVYLYAKSDFVEQQIAGQPIRHRLVDAGSGTYGYQITGFGAEHNSKPDDTADVALPRRCAMAEQEIFLSWSKPISKAAAEVFRELLPLVLPGVKPWMSSQDIEKGTAWFSAISDQLARSRACLLLITPENVGSTWLYYEAGAVAMKGTRIFPYLLGVKPGDLSAHPFGQYQVTLFDKEDTKQLIFSMNKTLEAPILESLLSSAFDGVWPKLQRRLAKLPPAKTDTPHAPAAPPAPPPPPLSEIAVQILINAVSGERHTITVSKNMHGFSLAAGGKNIVSTTDDRQEAEYRAAVSDLLERQLITDKGDKGEVFGITAVGYATAPVQPRQESALTNEAKLVVKEAAGGDGGVMMIADTGGFHMQAGGKQLCQPRDQRAEAAFRAAVANLVRRKCLETVGHKGEEFQLTHDGYVLADELAVETGA